MPRKWIPATGQPLPLREIADELTIAQAARACGVSSDFIAAAIKRPVDDPRHLPAHGVAGNSGSVGARGLGWRISKADLLAWWFGEGESHG